MYTWQGQSPQWSDLENWKKDGAQASELPAGDDHVVFTAAAFITDVVIDVPVTLTSLTVADDRPFAFSGKDGATLNVSGSFALNAGSRIESTLNIALTAAPGDGAVLACPESSFSQISFSETAYNKAAPFGTADRASCAFFTIVPDVTSPTCNGDSDGTAAVEEPADGVGPFSYQWVSGPSTREWVGVGAGTYTVIVIDLGQGGLPCSEDIFVNEPGPLALFAMNGTPPVCAGDCNGSAMPIVIGGNGGYQLEWSSGETGFMPEALCASFTLDVTDQLGCEFSTDFTFTDAPEPVTVTGDVGDVVCAGDENGTVDAQITGGDGNFTLAWTGPGGFSAATEEITGLVPGTYTLTATDGAGCEGSAAFIVNEFPPIEVTASLTDNLCHDGTEGAADLSVTGGLAPYSFSWTGPEGFTADTEDLSGLLSGTYGLELTDNNGCVFADSYEIGGPDELTVTADVTPVLCFGDNSGAIEAQADGGTSPYVYNWTGPNGFSASAAAISALAPGTYDLTVADANGCETDTSFEITEETEIEISLETTDVTCQGGDDGSVSASADGGVPPYSFSWTGADGFASGDQNIDNLAPGTYVLLLTDANGCERNAQAEVSDAPPILISGTVTGAACATGNTGAVSTEIDGGTSPFVFSWTGPGGYSSADQNISGLAPGTYDLTVTDAAGCAAAASFTVVAPDALTADFDIEPVSCFGQSTGSISTLASGGTGPYNYFWIGPGGFSSNQPDIADLAAGTYTLLLSDANGCSGFEEAVVSQNPNINITRVITNVTCFDGSDGAINITVSGGTPGYTYLWEGPDGFTSTSEDLSGVAAGTYTVTATDVNGCQGSRTYNVNQPAEIELSGTVTNVECSGGNDGAVGISVTSGAGPFTYAWTGPGGFTAATQNISGVSAGTYTATATNAAGCSGSAEFTVEEAPVLNVSGVVTDITCFGDGDGGIALTVEGGQPPYTVEWSGPEGFVSDENTLENLQPGTYSVSVTDDFGCENPETFIVSEPALLEPNIIVQNISCAGLTDGVLEAEVSGGTAPFDYAWAGPGGFTSATAVIDSLPAGEYALSVTDASGCTAEGVAELISPQLLTLTIEAQQPECLEDNGMLTAIVEGGTVEDDYSYTWVNSSGTTVGTDAVLAGIGPGTYGVTVTDDNGCEASQSIQLLRDGINLAASVSDVSCADGENGSITVSPASGTAPFTYTWTGPNGFTSDLPALSDLAAGTYLLTVEDATGCLLNESYDVGQPAPITFSPEVTPETCEGAANGSIDLNISGGTPGYQYTWSGPDGFSSAASSVTGLVAGIYTVTAMDINGCEASAEAEVGVSEALELTFEAVNPNCAGEVSGEIAAFLNGTSNGLTYAWEGPDSFTSDAAVITEAQAGLYSVTVSDAAGCEVQGTFELTEPEPLSAEVTVTDATCQESNGGITVIPDGGQGAYDINLADASGSMIADWESGLPAGLYEVIIVDAAGCLFSVTVTVSDAEGTVTGEVTPSTCSDTADGAISVAAEGGTPPFSFSWNGPGGFTSDAPEIDGLLSGNYFVSVTDENGCLYTAEFEVGAPEPLAGSVTASPVTCAGDDGSLSLTASGGTAPYEISWTGPGGFTADGGEVDGLIAGVYFYEITDSVGCSVTGEAELLFIADIEAAADVQEILCGGTDNGVISISLSGGTPPYEIAWSGPEGFTSDEAEISELAPGAYVLTVTDATECIAEFTYALDAPEALSLALSTQAPDCGASNGIITADISGGTAEDAYFIAWTDAGGNPLGGANPLEDLPPGNYTVSVSDDLGCTAAESVTLMNPGIEFDLEVSPISCTDLTDGAATLTVTADNPPVTVEWTGPNGFSETGEGVSGLAPGSYAFVITSADGCTVSGTAELDNPEALDFSAEITSACFGATDGAVVLTPINAVPEAVISWAGPDGFTASGPELDALAPGTYSFTLTDGNGCILTDAVEVEEASEIIAEVTSAGVSCTGETDGNIELTSLSGGTAPYTLSWTGPEEFTSADSTITGLTGGDYMLTVTDALGCTATADAAVETPQPLTASAEVTYPDCNDPDGNTGIALTVQGGTAPYDIVWTGENFISDQFMIENLEPGDYNYLLTDANGCTLEGTAEAEAFIPLSAEVTVNDISCAGEEDGSIEVTVIGGAGDVVINWSGPGGFEADQPVIEGLLPGTYSLLLLDEQDCAFQNAYTIEVPEVLEAEISEIIDANCNVSFDGAATGQASGGTEPYSYLWENESGFSSEGPTAEGLGAGVYNLTVTDAGGCTAQTEAEIDFIFEIFAEAGEDVFVCASELPVGLSGTGEGGIEFLWTDAAGDTLATEAAFDFSAVPGNYTLVFTAGNGVCEATDSLTVEIVSGPQADAGESIDVFAEEVFTLGGSPVSETGTDFAWSPAAGGAFDPFEANPSGFILETTVFTVVVTDGDGCTASDSVTVRLIPGVEISSGFTPNNDGVNDRWIIDNIELFPESLVSIFNRWGQLLYRQRAYNAGNAWDGTYEGQTLPVGTYYYTVELNDPRFPDPFTGPITIYR